MFSNVFLKNKVGAIQALSDTRTAVLTKAPRQYCCSYEDSLPKVAEMSGFGRVFWNSDAVLAATDPSQIIICFIMKQSGQNTMLAPKKLWQKWSFFQRRLWNGAPTNMCLFKALVSSMIGRTADGTELYWSYWKWFQENEVQYKALVSERIVWSTSETNGSTHKFRHDWECIMSILRIM